MREESESRDKRKSVRRGEVETASERRQKRVGREQNERKRETVRVEGRREGGTE